MVVFTRQGRRVPTDLDSRSTGKSNRTPNMESKLELRKLGHPHLWMLILGCQQLKTCLRNLRTTQVMTFTTKTMLSLRLRQNLRLSGNSSELLCSLFSVKSGIKLIKSIDVSPQLSQPESKTSLKRRWVRTSVFQRKKSLKEPGTCCRITLVSTGSSQPHCWSLIFISD